MKIVNELKIYKAIATHSCRFTLYHFKFTVDSTYYPPPNPLVTPLSGSAPISNLLLVYPPILYDTVLKNRFQITKNK